jgi:hypothetical protein
MPKVTATQVERTEKKVHPTLVLPNLPVKTEGGRVQLLATGEPLAWTQEGDRFTVTLPEAGTDADALTAIPVLKVEGV